MWARGRFARGRAHHPAPLARFSPTARSLPLRASPSQQPIRVRFEIPYFTVSGIQVRYLKIIEKSGYQALPWVRYITQNGDYQLRMAEPTAERAHAL